MEGHGEVARAGRRGNAFVSRTGPAVLYPPGMPLPQGSRRPLAIASFVATVAALSTSAPCASAESAWRQEKGELHGSQVASSEWLPIFIGGTAGVIVGGLTGLGFDDAQPPVVGPIVGGVLGGIAGGAGGAWLIRAKREQDTRLAGALSVGALGAGVGAILWANMDANGRALETVGKWGALVILPTIGAVVGHRLAIVWGSKTRTEAPPEHVQVGIRPSVNPVFSPLGTRAPNGMTFGFDATF